MRAASKSMALVTAFRPAQNLEEVVKSILLPLVLFFMAKCLAGAAVVSVVWFRPFYYTSLFLSTELSYRYVAEAAVKKNGLQ